jgi:hypothetical protein
VPTPREKQAVKAKQQTVKVAKPSSKYCWQHTVFVARQLQQNPYRAMLVQLPHQQVF